MYSSQPSQVRGASRYKKLFPLLILLVALIGMIESDHIQEWIRKLIISDDREPRPKDLSTELLPSKISSKSPNTLPQENLGTQRNDAEISAPLVEERISDVTTVQAQQLSIIGWRTPIHFIRVRKIVGSDTLTPEQIQRLALAAKTIGDSLNPSALILPIDDVATNIASPLLFAKSEFDLTEAVKQVYQALPETLTTEATK